MTVELSALAKTWPLRASASGSQPTGVVYGGERYECVLVRVEERANRTDVIVVVDRVPPLVRWRLEIAEVGQRASVLGSISSGPGQHRRRLLTRSRSSWPN